MNKYSAFGLDIWSEFELDELTPRKSTAPDVTISNGPIHFDLSKGIRLFQDVYFIKQNNIFLLHVKDIALYEVCNGNRITIQTLNNSFLDEFKIFLYGTCFNSLLLQREIVSLHGAGIVKDGKVSLFIGDSGKGKSTLTTYFIQHGYSFLADDVLPLKLCDDNQIQAGSSVGIVKLWEDSLNEFGLVKNEGAQIRTDVEKFRYVFPNSLTEGYFPISKIFILNWSDVDDGFDIQKLSSIEAIFYLREHVYRPQFITESEEYSHMMKLIISAVQQTEIFSINGKRSFDNLNTIKNRL
ncbi:hypothetical protein [Dyadobacter sediminis]|uniref:Serine kinase n=1 Tax=Dyadobacter sediminis TaxID=1493691 RepID=A0A5R9KIL8_9BACT|nr:hypothetical protein [Dyadobacter sediminis]TLU96061.1 hypothetical protein FEM55_02620 [Dyadobacter sediminis]GGB78925.1 hypothetical protein GCM10011325_03080 [Dyadobacter sediminis]